MLENINIQFMNNTASSQNKIINDVTMKLMMSTNDIKNNKKTFLKMKEYVGIV